MMKSKKRNIAVILSLVMLLAIVCSAWAAPIAPVVASTGENKTEAGEITISGPNARGLRALKGGRIEFEGSVTGSNGLGLMAVQSELQSYIRLVDIEVQITGGNVSKAQGIFATGGSSIDVLAGTIKLSDLDISSDQHNRGIVASGAGTTIVDAVCDIEVEGGFQPLGALAEAEGYLSLFADITLSGGIEGGGAFAYDGAYLKLVGNVTTNGDGTSGVAAQLDSELVFSGDIATLGKNSASVEAAETSTVNVLGGTISVSDDSSCNILLTDNSDTGAGGGTVNLQDVTAIGENLITGGHSGTVTATDSVLEGNILHDGTAEGTIDITLTDSSMNSAVEASGDIGTINITLEGNSVWNVTGDSDTNGKLTNNSGSRVDYNDAPAGTTVTVDTYEGSGDLNMKPGDKLVIKDGDSVVNLESSDDDVIEVVKNEEDGSYEITSKGEGNAELDYTYIDGNGDEQNVTIGVSAVDSIETKTSGSPDPDNIYPGDEVDITYSFTSNERDAKVVGVVATPNFADSGLTAKVDGNGDVILEGTADNPGSYYLDVNMLVDGTLVQRRVVVTVNGGFEPEVTGGDPEAIQPGDDVEITYDFGDENEVVGFDGSGLAGSDLTVGVDGDGNIVLEGTAGEPGNYFFEVEIKDENGKVRKQKMPVNIAAEFTTTGTPEDGVIESGMEVDLTYDFGDDYKAVGVTESDNFADSGLSVSVDADGNVVLEGTAATPGEYWYEVTLERPDGTTFTQKVPVVVEAYSGPLARSGGGSSNCNAGMGFWAMLSLLGMAVIQKRK